MVIKNHTYSDMPVQVQPMRIKPELSRTLHLVLNGLTSFGHVILVLTGMVSIFAGFMWERTVCKIYRNLGIKRK